MATDITEKPTGKVKNLTLSRSGKKFTAKWEVPTTQTKDSKHRATNREVSFSYSTGTAWHKLDTYSGAVGDHDSSHTISDTLWSSGKLKKVRVKVRLTNSKGKGAWSKEVEYTVGEPSAVSISDIGNESNTVNATFSTTDTSKTKKPRRKVTLSVKRSGKKNGIAISTTWDEKSAGVWSGSIPNSEAAGTRTFTYNDPDAQSFNSQDDYITYSFTATAYGANGSTQTKVETFTLKLARRASINGDIKANSNVISVPVKPIGESTRMQLQVGYSTSAIVPEGSWTNVGTEASGNSTMLSCSRGQVNPEIGDHTYFRVKTTYLGVEAYDQYSDQVECEELFAKSGGDPDLVGLIEDGFESGTDFINVKFGWKKPNQNYDATELSWSADQGAWRSSKAPDTLQIPDESEWNEGAVGSWTYSTSMKIVGLEEVTQYYFRARRYNTANPDSHSAWSPIKSASTGAEGAGVVLYADKTAFAFHPFTVSWSVSGRYPQTSWELKVGDITFSGDGDTSEYEVPGELMLPGTLNISLVAKNGGSAALTDAVEVNVVREPKVVEAWLYTGDYSAEKVIDDRAFSLEVNAQSTDKLLVEVISNGATIDRPDRHLIQYEGDVVWSEIMDSSMYLQDVGYGAEFVEGAYYTVRLTPMRGDIVGDAFETEPYPVALSNKPYALNGTTVTGDGNLGATISINPVKNMTNPTFNVYRVAVNGVTLIADGLGYDSTLTDPYAPFSSPGDMRYIIETESISGARDWSEVPYSLSYDSIVIDWDGNRLDLPYDITLDDGWQKQSEAVTYLDGQTEGHWNEGAPMRQSLSTRLFKIGDDEKRELITKLAKYPGSVFVRTPAGHAYEADVQVSSMSYSSGNALVACSLTATEVDNGGYLATLPFGTEAS